jgi:hypothetical protein
MGSINNGINYTIGFSDNFSAPLGNFSSAVGKVALDAEKLAASLSNLNPQLMQMKNMLSSAKGLGLLSKQLNKLAVSIKSVDTAISGKLNSRLALLVGNLEKFERHNVTTSASVNKTTMALEQQAIVAGALSKELTAVNANMTQIPNARKFRHLARANATLTSDATPYFVGGSSAVGVGSSPTKQRKFVPSVPMYQTMGKVGQQLRNVGQGAFQSALAMGFMAYPFMGVGGRGLEYTKDIEKMIRDAKLRSPDVQNNKKIETDLRAYLAKTYRENPFDRDKGGEILSTLGAYGISFKGSGGGFKGSLAQKFLELNIKGVEGLDMSPAQLAKAQSYMIANAKASGVTKDNDVVKYVGDRMSYVNYLADTFGVLEKDILRGSNEKIRAAVQGISPKYNTNLDDDASAFSAFIQRGTGRSQSKATSVGTSLLNRLSQRSYLVGNDKQAGLFNEAQAQDIRSVIAGKGGIAGVQAFFKLRDSNKKAMYQPFLKQGLGTYDAEGNFVRKKGITDKQQSAISRAELSFKAREKKTIGEYGDTIGILGSKTNLGMLEKMLNPNKEILASKGMDRVFAIMKNSFDGKMKTLSNALSGFASIATHSLMPSLMVAMDAISGFLNRASSFLESHPVLAKGFGATALASAGLAVGTLGFGMASNLVGSAVQGASLIGAGSSYLRKKSFGVGRKVVAQRNSANGVMSLASTALGFPIVNIGGNRAMPKTVIRPAGGAVGNLAGKLGGAGMLASGASGISGIIARLSASIPMLSGALATLCNPVTLTVLAVGALSAGVLVLISNLDGWKNVMSSTGGLLGSLATTVGLFFQGVGIAIHGMMLTVQLALQANPLTRGLVGNINSVGLGLNSGLNDLTKANNQNNKNWADSNKYGASVNTYRALSAKTGSLSANEKVKLEEAKNFLRNRKDLGSFNLSQQDQVNTEKKAIIPEEDRLYKANQRLTSLNMERFSVKGQLIANKFNPSGVNPDVKNQQIKKLDNEIMYTKKVIEQIAVTKAQKETTLKQTMELKNNTTALNNLTSSLGGLNLNDNRSGNNPRKQNSPPVVGSPFGSSINNKYPLVQTFGNSFS